MTCFLRLQLYIADWRWAIEAAHGLIPLDKWRLERRDVVYACLQVELEPAIGLLQEDLAVTQTELRFLSPGTALFCTRAEKTIRRDFDKRSGLKQGRWQFLNRTYDRRGRQRTRGWSGWSAGLGSSHLLGECILRAADRR